MQKGKIGTSKTMENKTMKYSKEKKTQNFWLKTKFRFHTLSVILIYNFEKLIELVKF